MAERREMCCPKCGLVWKEARSPSKPALSGKMYLCPRCETLGEPVEPIGKTTTLRWPG